MTEIKERVWKIEGKQDGKTICLSGGTHGNELTGVEAINRIKKMIDNGSLEIARGILYLMHANPRAIERGTRGSENHLDLNRRFTKDVMERIPNGTYEDQRAKELAPVLASCDIGIDLHSTNKPSKPMLLAVHLSESHKQLFQWFNCPTVVTDPKNVLIGEPSTFDDFVQLNGGLGMAFESGVASDISKVDEVVESLLNILRDQGMVDESPSHKPYFNQWKIYELTDAVLMGEEGFRFAEGRGQCSFEAFSKDDVLGYHGETPYRAPYDGFIIWPKVKELWAVGKPVMFLAIQNLA